MTKEEREDAIKFFKEVAEREVNNAKYSKLAIKALDQEPTYYPKFRNQQEKHRVFHTLTAVEKFFTVIGNDDAIDDISILKDLVIKMEVEE